jgi:hypothetical protein
VFKQLKTENDQEKALLTEVIKEFVPICAHCKSIRKTDGTWQHIETFLQQKSKEVQLSHTVCEECYQKYYPEA